MAPSRWVGVFFAATLILSLLLVGPGLAQDTTAEPTADVVVEATEAAPVETEPVEPTEYPFILYTVGPGDTLNRIAARFNTTIAILVEDNNIVNPNTVFLGSTLRIRPEGAPPP